MLQPDLPTDTALLEVAPVPQAVFIFTPFATFIHTARRSLPLVCRACLAFCLTFLVMPHLSTRLLSRLGSYSFGAQPFFFPFMAQYLLPSGVKTTSSVLPLQPHKAMPISPPLLQVITISTHLFLAGIGYSRTFDTLSGWSGKKQREEAGK